MCPGRAPDSTSSAAPASAARSRMLASPKPALFAFASDESKPTPSSSTTRTTLPSLVARMTSTRVACACLETLLSASCAMR